MGPVVRLLGALVVGAVGASAWLAFGPAPYDRPSHRVTLAQVEEETSWPYESSLQRAAAEWIEGPGSALVEPGVDVVVEPLDSVTHLRLVASATTSEAAERAATGVADAFLAHDWALQREAYSTPIAAYQEAIADLDGDYADRESLVSAASNASEIAVRSLALESTASLRSEFEVRLAEEQEGLADLAPRFRLDSSAPVRPLVERSGQAGRLLGAAVVLGAVVMFWGRRERLDSAAPVVD